MSTQARKQITMWGKRESSCCQAVLWASDELNIDVDLILRGGGYGLLGTAEYIALNPNKVVPTISDDGLILWESAAILLQLASTYWQGTLYPEDSRERAEAYRWVVWQQTTLKGKLVPLLNEWMLFPPLSRHLDELEERRLSLKSVWDILEKHLSNRIFLAGSAFTVADIPIGIMAYWWYSMPIDHFDLPNVQVWYERLQSRPAFRRHIARQAP